MLLPACVSLEIRRQVGWRSTLGFAWRVLHEEGGQASEAGHARRSFRAPDASRYCSRREVIGNKDPDKKKAIKVAALSSVFYRRHVYTFIMPCSFCARVDDEHVVDTVGTVWPGLLYIAKSGIQGQTAPPSVYHAASIKVLKPTTVSCVLVIRRPGTGAVQDGIRFLRSCSGDEKNCTLRVVESGMSPIISNVRFTHEHARGRG